MARISIKATYALDVETVDTLERIARQWAVSKSEALRRAVRAAAAQADSSRPAVERLDELQRSVALTRAKAKAWADEVRAERRAGTRRSSRKPSR
jgi:hypothetical protein